MASTVAICNRALQKVGASRITSLDENSKQARECNAMFDLIRDAELRAHPWSFAVKRKVLAASATDLPHDEGETAFPLPSDFLRLLHSPHDRDWQIEGRSILTRFEDSALEIRYVARIDDPTLFDPLFAEALAARLAVELVERITQSNTKKQILREEYDHLLDEARRANAIERPPAYAPVDPWIEARVEGWGWGYHEGAW